MNQFNKGKVVVRPCTTKDLQRLYGVSHFVMSTWLKCFANGLGKRAGSFYTVRQVALIYQELGVPGLEIEIL
jgi:hypothetical protein